MDESLFTRIIKRQIPADFLHEDESCIVIRDIHPQASTHLLVIPKKQIARLALAQDEDQSLLGHLLLTARRVAAEEGLAGEGFRIVINSGPHAGETVPHLHIHVLGGQRLRDGFGAEK